MAYVRGTHALLRSIIAEQDTDSEAMLKMVRAHSG